MRTVPTGYREASKEAPCKRACLAGVDIPRYIRLISLGKYDKALAVIRERNPFPAVCGRVCPAPCEKACQAHHNHLGGPVAINALKRFVAERGSTPGPLSVNEPSGKRVAVVGSGPAGLTASYYLAGLGHEVTVLEALPVAGGMMWVGIPEYRLPREVLEREIDEIKRAGVEIKTNTRVDSLDELLGQYDAIFLALGAHHGLRLGVEGEDSPAVESAVDFLREVSLGKKVAPGDRVVIIGKKGAVIDSARTALRLGSREVTVIYAGTREQLQASQEDVAAAIHEGVKMIFSASPQSINRQNGKLRLSCSRMEMAKPDESGQRQPTPVKDGDFSLECDAILAAIGETPDVPSQFGLKMGKGNTIKVDNQHTLATSRPGVFAGGDVVTGPASVIAAIAAGRRAALSIDKYLGGNGSIDEATTTPDEELPTPVHGVTAGKRAMMPTLPLKKRLSGFNEVELGLDEAAATGESTRCLWCDLPILADPTKCVGCLRCALMCSFRFEGAFHPGYARIKIVPPDRSTPPGEPEISFSDDCDGCGICVRTCSYGALTREKRQA
jgi:NADPH-dependent glutamate synthase beta subunit-like oxidoreductase/ferredoxin